MGVSIVKHRQSHSKRNQSGQFPSNWNYPELLHISGPLIEGNIFWKIFSDSDENDTGNDDNDDEDDDDDDDGDGDGTLWKVIRIWASAVKPDSLTQSSPVQQCPASFENNFLNFKLRLWIP